MKEKEEKYLQEVYFNPKYAGAFTGPDKLFRFIQKDGKYNISKKAVKKWIQSQEVYTTNRTVFHKINRRKVISPYIDYLWDADCASFRDYSKFNDGMGYFCLVIDIASRFVWTQAIQTPSGQEIKKVFENIFKTKRKPEHLRTDQGSEFSNTVMKKVFKHNKIIHYVTQNVVKANYAERAIQTFKSRIFRYLRAKQTYRWVDILADVTAAYNNTFHRIIKQTPASVTKKDENELWLKSYQPSPINFSRKNIFKFNIGDIVRISKLRKPFHRYYSEHWTNELFIVQERDVKQNIPAYTLTDYANEPILGIFYEPELQRVFIDENTVYNIEKVIKTRTRNKKKESLVRWVGWPPKFDTWIPSSDIQNYK
jgi:hypothetical protein